VSSTRGPDPDSAIWWYRVALGDLAAARTLAGASAPAARGAVVFAQQAAEKALKAALALRGTDPPRTHHLPMLARALRPERLSLDDAALRALNDGFRTGRYPEPEEPALDPDTVAERLDLAQQVLDVIADHLQANGVDVRGLEAL